MSDFLSRFNQLLSRPVGGGSRIVLVLSVVLLAAVFAQPLWNIHMVAPQYPDGLDLHVYAHTIEGGREGRDLQEINMLNHYIGMHRLERAEFTDLDWIPFAIGALIVLTLRVAVIGNVRALVDLTVIAAYFSVFSMGRFVYKLYAYGHNLDPHAPVRVAPFMPPVLGTHQLANFTVTSLPGVASFLMGAFVVVIAGLTLGHLAGRLGRPRVAVTP